ncbi:MAG: hypothetical protein K8F56_11735 [Rhodocyclaceae bacterium]|nr:hypothetical protein [Rhodocyclaceae bacterium]
MEPAVPTPLVFRGLPCSAELARYREAPGQVAIRLRSLEDGEPVACATVVLPDFALEPGHVLIKDYSENTGMLAALLASGLVRDTGQRVRSGYVLLPICELRVPAP